MFNIKNLIMKNKARIFTALILAFTMFAVSCSKDESPADSDFFVGTYNGNISFIDGDDITDITTDTDGRITVVKVGNSYTFNFGSGIPDITNVKFEKSGDNTYVSVGDGLTGITITANSLNALVINDRGTWTADCTR